jgi:hypothetical protein
MSNPLTQAARAEVAENAATIAQQRALNDMLARSATDRGLRALMLSDPHAAFFAAGVQVSPELDIVFIENRADVTIVLPDALDEVIELSEAELQTVNGGATVTATATLIVDSPISLAVSAVVSVVALTIYLAS